MPTQELIARGGLLAVLAISALYVVVSELRARARRRRGVPAPGVYPGSAAHQEALGAAGVTSMAEWRRLSTVEQEAADTAALDCAEQAELDAVDDAREAAQAVVERSRVNALFHP